MPIITTALSTGIFGDNGVSSYHYISRTGSSIPTTFASTTIRISGAFMIAVDGVLVSYSGISFIDDASVLRNAGQIEGDRGVSFDTGCNASVTNSGSLNPSPAIAALFRPEPGSISWPAAILP